MNSLDARATELLRVIAQDVSHELRGPVQSILVNLEVLRRKAANADTAALLERADIIEVEVQRVHELTDAFFSLLRADGNEAHVLAAESVLAGLNPIFAVRAKAARLEYSRTPADPSLMVRVSREHLLFTLLRLLTGVCAALAPGDAITLGADGTEDAVLFRLESRSAGEPGLAAVEEAVAEATDWLHSVNGTATIETGSDTRRIALSVRLPRAILTLTSSGG